MSEQVKNDQALVDLICRVTDTANGLGCPSLNAVIEMINTIDDFHLIVEDPGFREALADAQAFSSLSSHRWGLERMLLTAVRHIGEQLNLTLRWEHPRGEYVLLMGTSLVETYKGEANVWRISAVHNQFPVDISEYHECVTNNLFHALLWRTRAPTRQSIYGWNDPLQIGQPVEEVYIG